MYRLWVKMLLLWLAALLCVVCTIISERVLCRLAGCEERSLCSVRLGILFDFIESGLCTVDRMEVTLDDFGKVAFLEAVSDIMIIL